MTEIKIRKCNICDGPSKYTYCSEECKDKSRERTEKALEMKDELIEETIRMVPEFWDIIVNKMCKKTKLGSHAFGQLYKKIFLNIFRCYPEQAQKTVLYYKPADREKAIKIYSDYYDNLPEYVKKTIDKNKSATYTITPLVIKLWESGKSVHEISNELGLPIIRLKRIIASIGKNSQERVNEQQINRRTTRASTN